MKNAVANPAVATPKLIDICCPRLKMEFAASSLLHRIRVDQRIRARVLQRTVSPIQKRQRDNYPNRRMDSNRRKHPSVL
jgi:hypothetical protein